MCFKKKRETSSTLRVCSIKMWFEKDWFFWYIGAQRLHNGLKMVMKLIWSTLHDGGRFKLTNKGANKGVNETS